jgi:uncharacterized protein YjiS (DUF1127 family)
MLRPELAAASWHLPSPLHWALGWLARLVYLQARWRIRAELRMLNDAQLRDVGLTRAQVESELRRPFWKDVN